MFRYGVVCCIGFKPISSLFRDLKNREEIEEIFTLKKLKIMDIISDASDGRSHSRICTFQGRVKTNIYYRYLKSGRMLHAQPFEAEKMSGINVFVLQCTRLSCLKNTEGWV